MIIDRLRVAVIKTVTRTGLAALFAVANSSSRPASESGAWVAQPHSGIGKDKDDFSFFLCADDPKELVPQVGSLPPAGTIRIDPHPEGGVTMYLSADSEPCKDAVHPNGATHAIFVVRDTNPNESPGFSVYP